MTCTIAIPDLAGFLTGEWRMTRRIRDGVSGRLGRLTGTARFIATGGALQYQEKGVLGFHDWSGPAEQRYWLDIDSPGTAHVMFEDGRPFHRLDLSSGIAFVVHECLPDFYRGRYIVAGLHEWRLGWQVRGPRKHMVISTRFSREHVGRNA